MRLALAMLILGACTGPEAATLLEDAAKPPSERCTEARGIADGLVTAEPERAAQWRALALAACVQEVAG